MTSFSEQELSGFAIHSTSKKWMRDRRRRATDSEGKGTDVLVAVGCNHLE
jgi:hypothetical protein